MAALALRIPDDFNRPLEEMTQAETLRLFSDCFGITEEALVKAAEIVELWRVRGWDLEPLATNCFGWLHRLKLIAQGQLVPKLAVTFRGQTSWLDRFARYPKDEQLLIAEDKGVQVLATPATTTRDGKLNHLMLKPSKILASKEDWQQVFDRDHIRSLQEQADWLEAQKRDRERPRVYPKEVDDFKIDRESGEFCYRNKRWPKGVAAAILKALS